MKDLKNIVISMSKEFDDKNAGVTCEFSIHEDQIMDLDLIVTEHTSLKKGRWVIMKCDTCVEHNGGDENFHHASIERFETVSKMEISSNYIRTI